MLLITDQISNLNFQSLWSESLTPLINKFWKELIAYFPSIWHWPHGKRRLQQFFVAARTCLPSHCLAIIGGYTYRHTAWWEGFMKYAVKMGSGTMIYKYIQNFINIVSAVRKLIGERAGGCSRLFLARGYFYPEDGGDTFLRNVGSHKIYTASYPRRRHS
jgi:hypothetical protein